MARNTCGSVVLGVSGAERSNLRRSRWKTWCVVLQLGRRERQRRGHGPSGVSSTVFPGAHVLRRTPWLDRVRERAHAPRGSERRLARALWSYWRGIFSRIRIVGAFLDGTLLPIHRWS